MAVAWFLVPMVRSPAQPILDEDGVQIGTDNTVRRYCQMDDYTSQLAAVGGRWNETEVLGNKALVKVVAPQGAIDQLNQVAGFVKLPQRDPDTTLGDLSPAVRQGIRNNLEELGYPVQEIIDTLGSDLLNVTLRQVFKFAARRRLKPRYDSGTDTIVLDGAIVVPKDPDLVDTELVDT